MEMRGKPTDTNSSCKHYLRKGNSHPFAGHPSQMSSSFLILLERAFSRVYDVTAWPGLEILF